jgi:patatin-like phospholipase
MSLLQRLRAPGPKRILALDGGGIRGVLTLGYLKRIEAILRTRHDRPDLRLCDYFDLIGGTSTGAILAAGLAIGMSAEELERIYLDFGGQVFGEPRGLGLGLLRGRYNEAPLKAKLEEFFDDIRLGGAEVRTGLCIVTKRADTNSTWPLLNHPEGRYYRHNCDMLLREAVRASTAAPTYFDPQDLSFHTSSGPMGGQFVDGGVSMHNNPAMQLFLIATLDGFPFHWPAGEHDLLVASVGTGFWELAGRVGKHAWDWGKSVPAMLMDDATWYNQLLLQYFSRSPTAYAIDREIGDLRNDILGGRPLLTYLRYNARLDREDLEAIGLAELAAIAERLREMDDAGNRDDLNRVGQRAAERHVLPQHFPTAFDLGR